MPAQSAWAEQLGAAARHARLVECYRAWQRGDGDGTPCGGRERTARPAAEDTARVTEALLCFCVLAHERGAIPTEWDWEAFLAAAVRMLHPTARPTPLSPREEAVASVLGARSAERDERERTRSSRRTGRTRR